MMKKWHTDANQKFSYDRRISIISVGLISSEKKQSVKNFATSKNFAKDYLKIRLLFDY